MNKIVSACDCSDTDSCPHYSIDVYSIYSITGKEDEIIKEDLPKWSYPKSSEPLFQLRLKCSIPKHIYIWNKPNRFVRGSKRSDC